MEIYLSLYDRLKTQHQAIAPIIANADEGRLKLRGTDGKWSIHDNIAHLTRYQKIFLPRIDSILEEDGPVFERYSAESDLEFAHYLSMPLNNLMETYYADRLLIFNRLTTVDAVALSRMGTHPKYGRLTLAQWAEFFVLHEAHHLFTIFQLVNNKL